MEKFNDKIDEWLSSVQPIVVLQEPASADEVTSFEPHDTPSFAQFAMHVYPFLELQPFHENYYRLLEAFAKGEICKLMVSMPPQHGTSIRTTVTLFTSVTRKISASFSE